jgi:type IV pilus assembly protein PilY1
MKKTISLGMLLGLFLALVSGLMLAGTATDAQSEAARDTAPPSAVQPAGMGSSMCFDHPYQDEVALPHATGGAPRSVPDQSLVSFQSHTAEGYLFQTEHDPSNWRGTLKKFSVALDGTGQVVPNALLWDGGALLTAMPAALRNIFTLRPDVDQSSGTVPFTWLMLSPQQRAALDLAPWSTLPDGLGQHRLDFLRGDRSLEIGQPGGMFRRRTSVMGDAVHAAPLLVGAPSRGIPGAQYAAFFAQHALRPPVIYQGANDGMLHAFEASGGRELFAYVPNLLLPVLNQLSSPGYRHRPYVDGAAHAAEALVDGKWKTVLVAGLGGGGAGVLALDISAPDRFAQGGGALWEFGSNDDAAIGHAVDAPLIASFKVAAQRGAPGQRHFAVLAGGLDHPGRGALFLLALDRRSRALWRRGIDYYKLAPPESSAGAGAALGPPALVLDADGAVRTAYAGDLQGNLWRFDFSGKAPSNVAVQLLFVARDAQGLRQPITQRPNVVFATGGGHLVLFGTGKMNQASDNDTASFKGQSFYAIRDPGSQSGPSDHAAVSGRAALARRDLGNVADPADASHGWYLDFDASSGERSINGASLAGGKVFFNTVVPGRAPCTVAATRSYAVGVLSGLARGGALAPSTRRSAPVVLETASEIGPRSATGRALLRQHHALLDAGNAGIVQTAISDPIPVQRLSWREIANWPELHQGANSHAQHGGE